MRKTMNVLLRSAFLILAAMVGCAALLAGLVSITMKLTVLGASPAHFLPGKETVLYIPTVTPALVETFSPLFPDLREIAVAEGSAAAFLEEGGGNPRSVIFTRRRDGANGSGRAIGAYAVSVSHPLPAELLGHGPDRLADREAFALIAEQRRADLFTRRSFLPKPTSLQEDLIYALALGEHNDLAAAWQEGMLRISTLEDRQTAGQARTAILLVQDPILAFAGVNMEERYDALLGQMSGHHRAALEGIIGEISAALLGTDMSFRYHILPMLRNESTVQFSSSDDGVEALLEGRAESSHELGEFLERLHRSYRATLPATKTVERTLDQRYAAKDVRDNPEAIKEAREMLDGWNVWTTRSRGSERGLYTAYRGSRFLVATRESFIADSIQRVGKTVEFPVDSSAQLAHLRGGGYAKIPVLGTFAETILPGGFHLPIPGIPDGGTILWSVVQEGPVRTVGIVGGKE